MTHEEWTADGKRRFGDDMMTWRFVCPSCGHVQTANDYKAAGAPSTVVGFSCIGRWLPGGAEHAQKIKDATFKQNGGPCDYAGGGLIGLNPVKVGGGYFFAFAEDT